jgi:hypothetical protein
MKFLKDLRPMQEMNTKSSIPPKKSSRLLFLFEKKPIEFVSPCFTQINKSNFIYKPLNGPLNLALPLTKYACGFA